MKECVCVEEVCDLFLAWVGEISVVNIGKKLPALLFEWGIHVNPSSYQLWTDSEC